MKVTRMELDGAGSPAALVTKILKAEPDLTFPIPIEALARQLDIIEIRNLTTEGFEGGLITDTSRSEGFILVNEKSRDGPALYHRPRAWAFPDDASQATAGRWLSVFTRRHAPMERKRRQRRYPNGS